MGQVDLGDLMIIHLPDIGSQQSFAYSDQSARSDRNFLQGYRLALDLAFDSKLLRTICENEEEAFHELGRSVGEVLKHRLADLRAAISVNDLLVGRPRILDGDTHNLHMVIDLCDGYQVIFRANHPNNPVGENGKIDWQKVSRIKILRIESNYVQ
jgi:proteic killer suppression protein